VKLLSIAACCVFLTIPHATFGSTPTVRVDVPAKSSPRVRITVLLNGKAQKGARVEIYRYELGPGQEAVPRVVLTSDDQGRVAPPRLTPGHYHVIASADKKLRADLSLDILAQYDQGVSVFAMELAISPFPTREELLSEAEQKPIKDRVREFHGIVCDLWGAVIPGVSIEVVRKGTEGKDRVAQLKSGIDGQFSAPLSDGTYVALFYMSGFRTEIVPFEVTKEGSEHLRVTLQIAASN
jgi:Carboxypeptidase regulatory-like domain